MGPRYISNAVASVATTFHTVAPQPATTRGTEPELFLDRRHTRTALPLAASCGIGYAAPRLLSTTVEIIAVASWCRQADVRWTARKWTTAARLRHIGDGGDFECCPAETRRWPSVVAAETRR